MSPMSTDQLAQSLVGALRAIKTASSRQPLPSPQHHLFVHLTFQWFHVSIVTWVRFSARPWLCHCPPTVQIIVQVTCFKAPLTPRGGTTLFQGQRWRQWRLQCLSSCRHHSIFIFSHWCWFLFCAEMDRANWFPSWAALSLRGVSKWTPQRFLPSPLGLPPRPGSSFNSFSVFHISTHTSSRDTGLLRPHSQHYLSLGILLLGLVTGARL